LAGADVSLVSELHLGDDPQVRAMVALVEAQATQITSLRDAVTALEGRLAIRGALDNVVLESVRVPMNDLLRALNAMQAAEPAAPFAELAVDALERGHHLAESIEQLLAPPEVAPVSLDRIRLQPLNLRELVGKALALLRGGGVVQADVPPGLVVATSSTRLVAMINALVDNALRHGSEPIELRAEVMAVGDVLVQVSDRGPGLGGVDPETLFGGMAAGKDARTGQLGLYLVRRLAHSLGGEVTLADRPGGGALATLRLPQRRTGDDIEM
jgi:signal transduction histidine kinase